MYVNDLPGRYLTLPLTRYLLTCASEEDTFKAMSEERHTLKMIEHLDTKTLARLKSSKPANWQRRL